MKLAEAAKGSALALDFGISYRSARVPFSLGLSARNVGQGLKYLEVEDPLPLEVRGGASYLFPLRVSHQDLLFNMDFAYLVHDKQTTLPIGAEYSLGHFAFRIGHKLLSDISEITAGIGVSWKNLTLDYGIGLVKDLSNTHKIGLRFYFGSPESPEKTP